ncbi:MAG: PCRF domain-containing protein, partial [Polyangiales bacterium]
ARALQQWDERVAEEGPSAVWVLLRNADPLDDAQEWLQELVAMELAWCTRLHLAAEVVAWGQTEENLARVALEAEGPGAAVYLAMEQGVHRLHRTERGDLRVRIDVVPRRAERGTAAPSVHPLRPRAGYFDLESACAGRVEREERGLFLDFQGTHEATLSQLLADLDEASESLVGGVEVARTYAHGGSGARDPRTGANIPRYKDVMKGRLDPILEGWRRARYGKALPPREEG